MPYIYNGMKHLQPKLLSLLISFIFLSGGVQFSYSQNEAPSLVGYWHNWNTALAPYIPLDEVDERYDVISLAFAIPESENDMNMQFVPDRVSAEELKTQIEILKNKGKKVVLSVGGATATINLEAETNKMDFIHSLNMLIEEFGFNGLDIDIEHGDVIFNLGGSISQPQNPAQLHLVEAIQEVMRDYRQRTGRKLFLTMAPETAYIQGGQSAFGGIWGGYLPIVDALRDSIDILQVQLYNSGTMFGIDRNIYEQGTADFIVSQTEAVIQGFPTEGGFFEGLPAEKIAIALPACPLAAGGGYTDPSTVAAAVRYLRGESPAPESYRLFDPNGYATLGGMMTWSINWDAVSTCGGTYTYADNYETLFTPTTNTVEQQKWPLSIYPNPTADFIRFQNPREQLGSNLQIFDVKGRTVIQKANFRGRAVNLSSLPAGLYFVHWGRFSGKVVKL
ncbi:MAG: T9SS type A sorting domain-containing protein [Bacteroidetes bacterium]|jgi:chitinase|nr:T9SS type A sorting domain-containing protein [Bacteroidota bacterium]